MDRSSRIGEWEEHTKGIGSKLLEKMGYKKGDGLGKYGQGIKTPILPESKAKLSEPLPSLPNEYKEEHGLLRKLRRKREDFNSLGKRKQRLLDKIENAKETGEQLKMKLARLLKIYQDANGIIKSWQPLENPEEIVDNFKTYRSALEPIAIKYYDILMWNFWLPVVIKSIEELPSIRSSYEKIIKLLETWTPLLQHWLLDYIYDNIIGVRLKGEIILWDPLCDPTPIHFWIHPWLPLMADKLEPVFEPLRSKLATALQQWHPKDRSAKMILEPWKDVFSPDIWSAFLTVNILPKLEAILHSFTINPHHQVLDIWYWFIDWEDMLPLEITIDLLMKIFFPKWLHVLYSWLVYSPNYDEVTRWYQGWKAMFSSNLLASRNIQRGFFKALEMMNHAITAPGGLMTFQQSFNLLNLNDPSIPLPTPRKILDFPLNLTFEEIIDKKSAELSISYIRSPNLSHDDVPVYRFDKFFIYYKDNVIYSKHNNLWNPISLEDLCNRIIKAHDK